MTFITMGAVFAFTKDFGHPTISLGWHDSVLIKWVVVGKGKRNQSEVEMKD